MKRKSETQPARIYRWFCDTNIAEATCTRRLVLSPGDGKDIGFASQDECEQSDCFKYESPGLNVPEVTGIMTEYLDSGTYANIVPFLDPESQRVAVRNRSLDAIVNAFARTGVTYDALADLNQMLLANPKSLNHRAADLILSNIFLDHPKREPNLAFDAVSLAYYDPQKTQQIFGWLAERGLPTDLASWAIQAVDRRSHLPRMPAWVERKLIISPDQVEDLALKLSEFKTGRDIGANMDHFLSAIIGRIHPDADEETLLLIGNELNRFEFPFFQWSKSTLAKRLSDLHPPEEIDF